MSNLESGKKAFKEIPKRIHYGDEGTIHGTQHLDVVVDKSGKVIAVWFKCMLLPFEQHEADGRYDKIQPVKHKILAVDVII